MEETGTIIRDVSGQTTSKTFVIPGRQTSITATNLDPDTGYAASAYYTDVNGNTIYTENEVQFKTPVDPKNEYLYLENLYDGVNTFTLAKEGTPSSTDLSYKINADGDWNLFDLSQSSQTLTLQKGEKIYFRSSTGFSKDNSNYFTLNMSQSCGAGGNIASVFDYENMDTFDTIPSNGCANMFMNCSTLETPPYFSNVTSIGNSGLCNTFYGCSSLTTAPDLSNVTTINVDGLYQAFINCTSLTSAPDLPKVTLISSCAFYKAFYHCSSLTTPPDLSNVTIIGDDGCQEAFGECFSLEKTPVLSNVTYIGQSGCSSMFYSCRKLVYVFAPNVSKWEMTSMYRWLYNVASKGTFVKPKNLTIPSGVSGIPSGWTVVNS